MRNLAILLIMVAVPALSQDLLLKLNQDPQCKSAFKLVLAECGPYFVNLGDEGDEKAGPMIGFCTESPEGEGKVVSRAVRRSTLVSKKHDRLASPIVEWFWDKNGESVTRIRVWLSHEESRRASPCLR